MKTDHETLRILGQKLGFDFEGGLCAGYNAVWDEYYFNHELPLLYELLDLIAAHKEDFDALFINHNGATHYNQSLSSQNWLYGEIPALFETFKAFLSPVILQEISIKSLNQSSIPAIHALYQPSSHSRQVWSYCYAFDTDALNDFLEDFLDILLETSQSWVLRVNNHKHTVSISYNTIKNCWIYVDYNDYYRYNWLMPELHDYMAITAENNVNLADFIAFLLEKYPQTNKALLEKEITPIFKDLLIAYEQVKNDLPRYLSWCKNYHREMDTVGLVNSLFLSLKDNVNSHVQLNFSLRASNALPYTVKLLDEMTKEYYPIDSFQSTHLTADGTTLIMLASLSNDTRSLKDLLNQDTQLINHKDNNNQTALHKAAINGHRENVSLLLSDDSININESSKPGFTALHFAAHRNFRLIVKLLLDHKADINQTNEDGYSALHLAAFDNHEQIVGLLLEPERGADDNLRNNDGRTPLQVAVFNNNKSSVEQFLEKRTYCSACLSNLFMFACSRGHTSIARSLLKKGADVNHSDNTGNTLLHSATLLNDHSIARLLLDFGANVNLVNNDDQTPLYLAVALNHLSIVELFLEKHTFPQPLLSSLFRLACLNDCLSIASILREKGADINSLDARGLPALYYAASDSRLDTLHYLLKYKASLDIIIQPTPWTLIHLCAVNDSISHATKASLISHASEELINKQDSDAGCTALHFSCIYKNLSMIYLLLIYKANPDIVDKYGEPFIRYAQMAFGNAISQQLQTLITHPKPTEGLHLINTSRANASAFFKPNEQTPLTLRRSASCPDLGSMTMPSR